jgi:hypothetical protein
MFVAWSDAFLWFMQKVWVLYFVLFSGASDGGQSLRQVRDRFCEIIISSDVVVFAWK